METFGVNKLSILSANINKTTDESPIGKNKLIFSLDAIVLKKHLSEKTTSKTFTFDLSRLKKNKNVPKFMKFSVGEAYSDNINIWEAKPSDFDLQTDKTNYFILKNLIALMDSDYNLGTNILKNFSNLAYQLNFDGFKTKIIILSQETYTIFSFTRGEYEFENKLMPLSDILSVIDKIKNIDEVPLINIYVQYRASNSEKAVLERNFFEEDLNNVSFFYAFD